MTKRLHFLKHTARLMLIALCVLSALYSYAADTVSVPANITMVTDKATVSIILGSSGKISIDWGDSSKLETFKISNYTPFNHTYSGISERTIRIYGKNITFLGCNGNKLTALDVSNNAKLAELNCYSNKLTALNISNNKRLTRLHCTDNPLTSLDVTNNKKLTRLDCDHNKLTTLDVSNNTELIRLSCVNNKLTDLDVSNNTALNIFFCTYNQLSVDGLNSLFGTLHNKSANVIKAIYIGNNPGTAGCNRTMAKGWTVRD